MRRSTLFLVALALVVPGFAWAQDSQPTSQPADQPTSQASSMPTVDTAVDYSDWNHILATYLDDQARFSYVGLAANAADMERLNAFVALVGTADMSDWTADQTMAFRINAYNALVVKTTLEHWPIESVMDVGGFFDRLTNIVAGETITLNDLENNYIRSQEEPRIHFAVNCGAVSCPPLRSAAYTGADLEAQLEEMTAAFLLADVELDREGQQFFVSKIFEWFQNDFEYSGAVRGFIAQRLPDADGSFVIYTRNFVRYRDYDWALNAQE